MIHIECAKNSMAYCLVMLCFVFVLNAWLSGFVPPNAELFRDLVVKFAFNVIYTHIVGVNNVIPY